MSIDMLSRVLPPPQAPTEARGSWSAIEESLGIELPEDYKAFVETYGSGAINQFVTIFNPFSEFTTLNLAHQSQRQLGAIRFLIEEFGAKCPYGLFPESPGLLPFGMTDNGDVIHWLTRGKPDEWVVVVNESRGSIYEQHECGLSTFLTGLFEGSLKSKVFPDLSETVSVFVPIHV